MRVVVLLSVAIICLAVVIYVSSISLIVFYLLTKINPVFKLFVHGRNF